MTWGDYGVACVFTNPLPTQDVEKLGADIDIPGVERRMEMLAEAAKDAAALSGLPLAYAVWTQGQVRMASLLEGVRRREIAKTCLENIETARRRIESGIARLKADATSREAFALMNRAMNRANRQRGATLNGNPPTSRRRQTGACFSWPSYLLYRLSRSNSHCCVGHYAYRSRARLRGQTASAEGFVASLAALDGAGSRWPGDDEFRRAWMTDSIHDRIGDIARIRGMLAELENGMRSPRAEEIFVPSPGTLDIDHILPDKWYEHWQLDDETVTAQEASQASLATFFGKEGTPRQTLIARREQLKATVGNLNLAHYGVNRSAQNSAFETKRKLFFAESNLHLNRSLMVAEVWNEDAIEQRGRELFEIARSIWKGPS